jgi:hypothetical protein
MIMKTLLISVLLLFAVSSVHAATLPQAPKQKVSTHKLEMKRGVVSPSPQNSKATSPKATVRIYTGPSAVRT